MRTNRKIRRGKIRALLWTLGVMICSSCADGYDSPNGFDLGVKNTQMESPDSVSFIVSADGKSAVVSWDVVPGADGHVVTFQNVDDPDNPVVIDGIEDKVIDGSRFTVSVAEDSKYKLSIRTLGNKKLNNTDAAEAKTYDLTTLIPKIATIPSGSDIYEWWQAQELDTLAYEVAIELEPGGEYTLSDQVDFAGHLFTFRGDKVNRPVVRITGNGSFATYNGLKVKFINFDMTDATAGGFVCMSKDNLPDNILSQNLGFMRSGAAINGIYNVLNPIYISQCWFKNLPHAMLYCNDVACAYWNFTVSDCIVQMNNTTKSNIGFINLYNTGRQVKNIVIENSTIYNIVDNDQACFARYAVSDSNTQPEKVFGNTTAAMNSTSWKISKTTFSKTYTGWRWVNNVSGTGRTMTIDHSLFYDVSQLYRVNSGTRTYRFNVLWSPREDDITRNSSMGDSGGATFAAIYDPKFQGDVTQELDFSKPNGGVDFTPTEPQVIANGVGDPRWLAK
ncbi:MAG: DUF4957 domain-containing protein [Prevotella sp.]|nr:DUF4957 domain-containing protein [Prevotella sp.]